MVVALGALLRVLTGALRPGPSAVPPPPFFRTLLGTLLDAAGTCHHALHLPPHPTAAAAAVCCQAGALDRLEAFASFNGPDFYGLPRNSGTVTLVKQPWTIPEQFGFGSSHVVPMWAGETLGWAVEA